MTLKVVSNMFSQLKWLVLLTFILLVFVIYFLPSLTNPVITGTLSALLYFFLYIFSLLLMEKLPLARTKSLVFATSFFRLILVGVFLISLTVISGSNAHLTAAAFLLAHTFMFIITQSKLVFNSRKA